MNQISVEPKSRQEICELAHDLRSQLHLDDVMYIPIVSILERLEIIVPKYDYEIVEDSFFSKNIHGDTDIIKRCIRIKESVYNGAFKGNGRDRMTIAHEIAHFVMLCHYGFKLQRSFGEYKRPAYRSPEWQAKCFAGEFMIDNRLMANDSPQKIASACGVSMEAALYQYNKIHNYNYSSHTEKGGDAYACLPF